MLAPAIAPAPLIEDRPELEAAVARLRAHTRLACDTESNSLHAYRGRTCLIQISSPDEDLLIDPLAIADMSPLAPLFADPAIEKIFHAAEYDLICLKRDFDFDVHNVFDTMAAGRVCGYQRFGLSHMLADKLGVQHPKRHQRDNWGRRPLPESYRRYAQMDTHYLLPLRAALYAELEAAGRLEEAGEYFSDILNFELKPQEFDPEGFWALYRPNSLNRAQLAVLRELYILREELAKSVDHPSHRLISNKTLLQIVKTLPRRRSQLARIRGLPRWLLRQSGDEIIESVQHGLASRLSMKPPRRQQIAPAISERYTALYNWRKRRALDRGVESDVIISKGTLWHIARRKPLSVEELRDIRGLGPWRRRTYGPELVAIVNGSRPTPP